MTKYALEYRTGGRWRRTLIIRGTMTEALLAGVDVERMGYETRAVPVKEVK